MGPDAQHAAYIVIDGPGHEGTRLALREGITSFGRLPANDVILLGDLVSRHHSRITFFEGRATLQDLGSHNGSWVNGERTTSRVLTDGDAVRVGNFRITFRHGPIPTPLDETTAGEGSSDPVGSISEDPEGVAALLRELESARSGAPSPARAVHFLYRTTEALARAGDADTYAALLLDLALEHIPSDGGAWLELTGRRLDLRVQRGPDGPVDHLDVHVPAVEWSLDKRIAVRAPDIGADLRFGRPGAKGSVLSAPLFGGARPQALYLRRSDRPYGPADLHRLGVIAHLMQDGLRVLAERGSTGSPTSTDTEVKARIARASPGRPAVEPPSRAVVVMLDLHGLSPNAEKLPAESVLELTAYFQTCAHRRAREAHALALDQNGHRALLAFGVDEGADAASARAALETTLEVRNDVDAWLRRSPSLGPRRVRAGISAGLVLAGAYAGERSGLTLLGAPTATARRLVEASGAGRVLADEAAVRLAGGGFELQQIGTGARPGGAGQAAIFEVLGRSGEMP